MSALSSCKLENSAALVKNIDDQLGSDIHAQCAWWRGRRLLRMRRALPVPLTGMALPACSQRRPTICMARARSVYSILRMYVCPNGLFMRDGRTPATCTCYCKSFFT